MKKLRATVPAILAVNAGSSSLKFKLFKTDSADTFQTGKISGVGSSKAAFTVAGENGKEILSKKLAVKSEPEAVEILIEWLRQNEHQIAIQGIGHRIVHGGSDLFEPSVINKPLLRKLKAIEKLAPLHLPDSLSNLRLFLKAFPGIVQVASFDTRFHREMPQEAKTYALPAAVRKLGIQRYGFHGLSCEYIINYLENAGNKPKFRKIIIAHLGSGSSLTAVSNGKSVDTTMGFTPTGGIAMGSRSGDIDPGIVPFLLRQKDFSAKQLDEIFNKNAGLLGLSAVSSDLSVLLKKEPTHKASALAIAVYCYSIKKVIGSFAAVMDGIDELIFTGGVGEKIPPVRQRICDQMTFLGLQIAPARNQANQAEVISSAESKVVVRVIATDEEYVLAKNVSTFL